MKILAAAAVLACVVPAHGFAQEPVRMPAQEADQIRRSVTKGQKVLVTDDQGRLFKGKIGGLADAGLTVEATGTDVDVPYAEIRSIKRFGDKVIDGALIGFGAGSVIGYLWARPREQDRDCPPGGWCFSGGPDLSGFGALVGGVAGAVVGAVVDALIPSSREVYRRPVETRLVIFPAVNRTARGVVVSVGW